MGAVLKVFAYAKDYKNKLYLAVVLATVAVLIGMAPYYLVYKIIMRFIDGLPLTINYFLLMAGLILLCLLGKSFLYFKALAASHEAAFDTLMGMREKIADKMIKMPLGAITEKSSGQFKNLFVDVIEDMEIILAHMIPEGISNLVVPLAVITYLFVLDWRMALLALGTIPIGILVFSLLMRGFKDKLARQIQSSNQMNSNIVEYINGMEVIKIFNQTASSFQKYTESVENYKEFTLAWYQDSWNYFCAFFVIVPATILFVLPFGALFYAQGTLTLSTYILAMLLAMGLGMPLTRITEFGARFQMVTEKSKSIEELFSQAELVESGQKARPHNHNISFNRVTFAYQEKDVLENTSFEVKENTVTALVGASGSGKSTIAKLLVRFWDVKSGAIKIGNVNIRDISFADLMNYISYVSQDIFLFNTSIIENIRLGKPEASEQEVIRVAKLAQCHDFIMETEKGYATFAGNAGDKLSGGQRQRISLARALLKDAPIIVLDEATAFADPENEDKIQQALNGLISSKTLIVIAHRLSTIVGADQIILMDKGTIAARGTHEQLLAKSELYHGMWRAHLAAMDWDIAVKGEGKQC